ncbi:hypothetical protein HK102_003900 [Quaeritorhiza haematococci]|nr:hypothetical protein HK102_003900 [Quaeritorhiza haematococci]
MHSVTPLIPAPTLARSLGVGQVLLKLDNMQPTGSFKVRGIGHQVAKALKTSSTPLKYIISSSGGNAGLAAAWAGRTYGVPVHVFVPETTPKLMVDRLEREYLATVTVHGKAWDDANAEAQRFFDKVQQEFGEGSALFLHPFDNADLWEGHSTIISEIKSQMAELERSGSNGEAGTSKIVPDVVVCAVGGGGLLNGILQGILAEYGGVAEDGHLPYVVAVETEGAASLAAAFQANELVEIPGITSIAKSLGARKVSARCLELREVFNNRAMELKKSGGNDGADGNTERTEHVISHVVSDGAAVKAVFDFADDFRFLVEPACGAALSVILDPKEFQKMVGKLPPGKALKDLVIVGVVCGGSAVTFDLLRQWNATVLGGDSQ